MTVIKFFEGENEMFNLSVAIAGHAIDVDTGTYKFIGGGSGGGDGSTNAASAGADGGDSNWADYQVVVQTEVKVLQEMLLPQVQVQQVVELLLF